MPTEHEYKYLVSMDLAGRTGTDFLTKKAKEIQQIKQGYLNFSKGTSTRVRCITNDKENWSFTYKQKVGERVIEIEKKKLDNRDGQDLWSVCIGKLEKTRYVVEDNGLKWEIDFFKNGDKVYFVLAEIELPEGAPRPESVPNFLKDRVLYEVGLEDDRFSSKRLSDVEFATNLYKLFQDV